MLCWGRRAGKTEHVKREMAEEAQQGKPVAYLAPTYKMLAEVFRVMSNRLRPLGCNVLKVEHRIEFPNGGSIDFWSMEDGANAVRGRKYSLVVLDECALVPGLLMAWEEAIRPTLADYKGRAIFISTPRRGGGFQELFDRGGTNAEWASHRITSLENPHLPEGEVPRDEVEAVARGMSVQAYRQEFLADFEAADSDLVFPEFDRHLHVRDAKVGWAECKWRVAGIDPGGGDPTAIVPLGVTAQEHVHQYGEFYRKGDVAVDDIVTYLSKLHAVAPFDFVVVDPSQAAVMNTLRRYGFNAYPANHKREEGMEVMRWLLQSGRLTIAPACTNSIAEFPGYRWAKRRDGETGERYATRTPVDHHADAMDARRYAAVAILDALPTAHRGPMQLGVR